jgi:hypothetical protein
MSKEISPEDLWYCDLSTVIEDKLCEGHDIIVAGKFNDDLNNPKGKTRKFMENLGLHDLISDEAHGHVLTTHIRGSMTIDAFCIKRDIYEPG